MGGDVTMDSHTIGVAFGLVILAGACAPLGAAVVLLLKTTDKQHLSAALALAGGVMVFISLAEVLGESKHFFEEGGSDAVLSSLYTYLVFFGGIFMTFLLDYVADYILRASVGVPEHTKDGTQPAKAADDVNINVCIPGGEAHPDVEDDINAAVVSFEQTKHDAWQLMRTSIMIGLALALHNLPEGLATFVGYMADPKIGITIAISIAVHNIPEGIAVGVPVYFATGRKMKAIGWAALSGVVEPLGALIGMGVVLNGDMSNVAMGVIMGLTAGIMVGVAFRELIPRALEYDKENKSFLTGTFGGMAIMAASLVLLELWA